MHLIILDCKIKYIVELEDSLRFLSHYDYVMILKTRRGIQGKSDKVDKIKK